MHGLVGLAALVAPAMALGTSALPANVCDHEMVVENYETYKVTVYDCQNTCTFTMNWNNPTGTLVVKDSNGGTVESHTYDIPSSYPVGYEICPEQPIEP